MNDRSLPSRKDILGAGGRTDAGESAVVPGTEESEAESEASPEVLFVCIQNAGRSQMAAALLRHHGGGRVRARCAGSRPADRIHPGVAEVMAELGIDLRNAKPQALSRAMVETADVIVTMGCGDACPVLPGRTYEDWQLPDPAGLPKEEVRKVRDTIELRVQELLTRLLSAPGR